MEGGAERREGRFVVAPALEKKLDEKSVGGFRCHVVMHGSFCCKARGWVKKKEKQGRPGTHTHTQKKKRARDEEKEKMMMGFG
jgi:hypothetical protein